MAPGLGVSGLRAPGWVQRNATTTAADMTIMIPTAHIPARPVPVRSFNAPVAYGAANPPRFPTELINDPAGGGAREELWWQRPEAGDCAEDSDRGNGHRDHHEVGLCRRATGIAKPPTSIGIATCQAFSLVRSACLDQKYITTEATA